MLVAYLVALALAAVLVVSAAAKLADLPGTARGFRALGLPAPYPLARATAAAEGAVAGLLVVVPRAGGVVALGLLAVFSAVLADALRRGVEASCACFGSRSSGPISPRQLARNAVLGVAAVVVVAWAPTALWRWAG